jgi:hypothetical protein
MIRFDLSEPQRSKDANGAEDYRYGWLTLLGLGVALWVVPLVGVFLLAIVVADLVVGS